MLVFEGNVKSENIAALTGLMDTKFFRHVFRVCVVIALGITLQSSLGDIHILFGSRNY